uniref:Uncharacterized protein n=1 Tax=Heterorhabditis bacteriophora TaxID=37862 RepID=A0A1I7WK12_HETBA
MALMRSFLCKFSRRFDYYFNKNIMIYFLLFIDTLVLLYVGIEGYNVTVKAVLKCSTNNAYATLIYNKEAYFIEQFSNLIKITLKPESFLKNTLS